MESLWEKDVPKVCFEAMDGNENTDVLIIGGGISGILCAYKLKTAGVDCMLVEAAEICSGITKNTTAKTAIAIYITGNTSVILALAASPIKIPTKAGVNVAITELNDPPI